MLCVELRERERGGVYPLPFRGSIVKVDGAVREFTSLP